MCFEEITLVVAKIFIRYAIYDNKGLYTLDIFAHNIAIKTYFRAMDLYRPRHAEALNKKINQGI